MFLISFSYVNLRSLNTFFQTFNIKLAFNFYTTKKTDTIK